MVYRVEYDPEAALDLHHHRRQQSWLRREIENALAHEPLKDTLNNGSMRPNALDAERRLRRPPFRIYYEVDTDEHLVYVLAVCEKRGSRVFRRGKEIQLDDDQNEEDKPDHRGGRSDKGRGRNRA